MELPEWIRPGVPVWYMPSPSIPSRRFLGMIATAPRLLGGHTWVVRLHRMERQYGRDGVPAASLHAIQQVVVPGRVAS